MYTSLKFDVFELREKVQENLLLDLTNHVFEQQNYFQDCDIDPEVFGQFVRKLQDSSLFKKVITRRRTTTRPTRRTCSRAAASSCSSSSSASWPSSRSTNRSTCWSRPASTTSATRTFSRQFNFRGFTNKLLARTNDELAIVYNGTQTYSDQSVIQHYSLTCAFRYMARFPIFQAYTPAVQQATRQSIIQLVLSTDMTRHFQDLNQLNSRINQKDFDLTAKDKNIAMQVEFQFTFQI